MLRRFKCVLSAALVAVLLFTLFPLASFAADPSIKFSVTKYTLTPEELEEIEPDKEEDVGNYADLYPVPLIVRVAVGGSGKLVGADFYVSYEGDKLQYSRTINYDSIIDDTANMAASDPQTDTGNRKKINISFFFSEHYALKSQGESIIYLMFYVKRIRTPQTKSISSTEIWILSLSRRMWVILIIMVMYRLSVRVQIS